jgi:hypothetical protein
MGGVTQVMRPAFRRPLSPLAMETHRGLDDHGRNPALSGQSGRWEGSARTDGDNVPSVVLLPFRRRTPISANCSVIPRSSI